MRRRALIRAGIALGAWLLGSAHTPYRQWQVYRKRHLVIGTSRADAPSYPLGKRIAFVLLEHLPESSARVTRGPDPWRLASLLTTSQLDVVLLSADDAASLQDGRPPFEAFGPTEMRALARLGAHLLVTRPDFPDRHAYLIAMTLLQHGDALESAVRTASGDDAVPAHPGALAYAAGAPEPTGPEVASEEALPADHVH
jgi:TRAP-type uncharacterized transport system substrate-binding protein